MANHPRVVIVVLAAILGSAIAGPVSLRKGQTQCASYCRATDKFHYEPGKTYVYDYETLIESRIHADHQEHATLRMTAKADFSVLAPCEILLTMRDVRLEERDARGTYEAEDMGEFAAAIERFPIRFAFQDGLVESLCPVAEDAEADWVVNVKRGVVSLFQNSMNELDAGSQIVTETDVAGICETRYDVSHGIYSTSVTKTKDLLTCAERHARLAGLDSVPYANPGPRIAKNLPVLQSTHECTQTIRGNRMEKSECKETHSLAPFKDTNADESAAQQTAANTVAIHSLTFSSERTSSVASAEIRGQTSLLFEPNAAPATTDGETSAVLDLVRRIEADTAEAVNPDSPRAFSSLVALVKQLGHKSLDKAVTRAKTHGERASKILLDAISLAGTGPAVAVIKDHIAAGNMKKQDAEAWLTSLAFTSYPTDDMIAAVAPLLEDKHASQQALLGVSAMAHRYCARVPDCGKTSAGVKAVVAALETRLRDTCKNRADVNVDAALVTLKALGNVGVITDADTLLDCASQDKTPTEIRAAALQALRRLPCDRDDLESKLADLFADHEQDSELRINAYLSMMRCPSPRLMSQVQAVLAAEPVNQVGSFVWTHLTNLQESQDPSKQYARDLLASDFLRNKFNTDARKFSRNYEAGFRLPGWNAGAQAESNVIFSTASFLPRSANLNLTAHLFGEAVNLLEVGGRVEGLEQLVENLFGDNGYLPKKDVSTVFKSTRDKTEIHPDELGKHYYDAPKDVSGHAYARVFGNDLMFHSFRNKQELTGKLDAIHPESLLDSLLSGKEIDLTKNIHFLDTEFTVPLASGFPLHLALNGTASLRLLAKGQLQAQELFTHGKAEGSGDIKPSAAIEIHGLVSVGAGKSRRTGMSLRGTLHTSSMISASFKVDGSKLVSARINVPWQKMEILEMGTQVSLLRAGRPIPSMIESSTESVPSTATCTGHALSRLAGIEACVTLTKPSNVPSDTSLFLAGNTQLGVFLRKTDTFQSYNVDYTYSVEPTARGPVYSGRVKLDTPGSQQDRLLSTHAVLDVPQGQLKWRLQTPVVSAAATGAYSWTPSLKALNVTLDVNEDELLSVASQVKTTSGGSDSIIHEPSFALNINGRKPLRARGRLETSKSKFNGKLSIDGVAWKPITVKASGQSRSTDKGKKVQLDGVLDGPHINAEFHVYGRAEESAKGATLNTKYSIAGKPHETLDASLDFIRQRVGSLTTTQLKASLDNTAVPEWATKIDWTVQTSPGHVENTVDATLWNGYRWKAEQFALVNTTRGIEIDARLRADCQKLGVDFATSFSDDVLSAEGTLKLNKDWESKADVKFTHVARPFKVSASGSVTYPGKEVRGAIDLFSGNDRSLSLETYATSEPDGSKFRAVGTYNDASSELRLDHQLDLEAGLDESGSVTFQGRLRAEGRHASVSVKVGQGSTIHEGSVSVATKGDASHDVTALIRGPGYKYAANGHLELRPDTVAAAFDLDNDQNKYALDLKMRNGDEAKSLDASVSWQPDRRYDISAILSPALYAGKISYPGYAYEAELALTKETTVGSVSWAPEQRVSVVVSHVMPAGLEGEFGVEVKTPFEAIRHGKGLIHYSFQGNNLKATALLTKDGRTLVESKLDGERGFSGSAKTYEGSIAFDGQLVHSFGLDSDARFKVTVDKTQAISASLSGTWQNEQYAVRTEANKSLDGSDLSANAELEVGSRVVISANAGFTRTDKASRVSAKLVTGNKDSWSVDASVDHDTATGSSDMTVGASVTVKTPVPDYEHFEGSVHTEITKQRALKAKAAIRAGRVHYQVVADGATSTESKTTTITGHAVVSGSELPVDMDIKFEHKFNASGKRDFSSVIEAGGVFWHPLKVHVAGKSGRADVRGNFAVTCLGKSADGKFRLRRDAGNTRFAAQAQYEGDKIELDVDAKITSLKNFEVSGSLDNPWMTATKFQVSHSCNQSEMKTSAKVEQRESVVFTLDQHLVVNRDTWRSTISAKTPFPIARTISLNNEHQILSGTGLRHDVKLERNNEVTTGTLAYSSTGGKYEIEALMSGDAVPLGAEFVAKVHPEALSVEASGRLEVQGLPEYKFLVNGRFDVPHGALELKMQRQGEADILDANFNYFVALPESQAAGKVQIMGHNYLDAGMTAEINVMNSKTTAFFNIPSLELKLSASHDIESTPVTGILTGVYNGKKVELRVSGTTEDFLISSAKVELETPCEEYKTIGVTFNYDMSSAKKTFGIGISRNNDNVVHLESSLDLSGDELGGKADVALTTSWEGQPWVVKVAGECRTQKNKEYSLDVNVNERVFAVSARHSLDAGLVTFALNLDTQVGDIDKVSLNIGYAGFTTATGIVKENARVWIEGKAGPYASLTKAEIGRSFRNGDLTTEFNGPSNVIPVSASAAYDIRNLAAASARASCSLGNDNYELDIETTDSNVDIVLKTPHEHAKHLRLQGTWDTSRDEKTLKLQLHHNGENSEVAASVQTGDASHLKGQAKVSAKTPFRGFKNLSAGAQYDMLSNEKLAKIFLENEGVKSEMETIGRVGIKDGELNIRATLPGFGSDFEDLAGTVSYSNEERRKRAAVDLRQGPNTANYATELEMDHDQMSLSALSPHVGYQRIGLLASTKDNKFTVEAEKEDKKTIASFSGRAGSKSGNGHLVLASPLFGGIDIELHGNYDNGKDGLSTDIVAKVNKMSAQIQGRIVPELRGSASLQVTTTGSQMSQVSASWDLVSRMKRIQASVTTPEGTHTFVLAGEISNGTVDAEISLPFAGWENMKLTGRYKIRDTQEVLVEFQHGTSRYEVLLEAQCANATQACAASAAIKTPEFVFGSAATSFDYKKTADSSADARVKVSYNAWATDVSASARLDAKKGSASITADSTTPGWEALGAQVEYNFAGKGSENSAKVSLRRNQIRKEFEAKVLVDDADFMLAANTPFKGFSSVQARVSLESNDQQQQSRVLRALFQKEAFKASVQAQAKLTTNSGMLSVNADVPTLTNWIGAGKFIAQYSIPQQQNGLNVVVESQTGIYSGKLSLDASSTRGKVSIIGESPMGIEILPAVNCDVNYNLDTEGKTAKLSWRSQNGQQSEYGITADMNVSSKRGNGLLKLSAPGQGWWTYANAEFTYSTHSGSSKFLTFTGKALSDRIDIQAELGLEGTIRVKTPIDGLTASTLSWKLANDQGKYVAELDADIMDTDVNFGLAFVPRAKNSFQLDVSAKSRTLLAHPTTLSLDIDANVSKGHATGNTRWGSTTEGSAAASANWRLASGDGFITANVESPFTGSSSAKVNYNIASSNVDIDVQLGQSASFQLKGHAGDNAANAMFKVQSALSGTIHAEVAYDLESQKKSVTGSVILQGIKYEIDAALDAANSFRVDGTISIKAGSNSSYKLRVDYDLRRNAPNKTVSLLLDLGNFGHFSITGAVEQSHAQQGKALLNIKSSHEDLSNISLKADFDFQTNPTGSLQVQWSPTESLEASFNIEHDTWKQTKMAINVQAPFANLDIFQLETSWNLAAKTTQKTATAKLAVNEDIYSGTLSLKNDNQVFSTEVLAIMPRNHLEIGITTDKVEKTLALNININGQKLAADASITGDSYKKAGVSFTGVSTLKFVSAQREEAKFVAKYDVSRTNKMSAMLDAAYNGQEIQLTGGFDAQSENKIANLDVRTPFPVIRSFTVDASMDKNSGSFAATFHGSSGAPQMIRATYATNGQSHSLRVETPFEGYTDLSAEMQVDQDNELTANLRYGKGEQVHITGQYDFTHAVSVNATLKAPIGSMAFNSYVDAGYMFLSGMLNNEEASVSAHWKKPLDAQIRITTPWTPYESIFAKINVGIESTASSTAVNGEAAINDRSWGITSILEQDQFAYKAQGRAVWDQQSVAIETGFAKRGEEYDAKFVLKTSFEQFDSIVLHGVVSTDLNTLTRMTYFNGNVKINTPFPQWQSAEARILARNSDGLVDAEFVAKLNEQEISGKLAIGQKENGTYKLKVETVLPTSDLAGVARTSIYGSLKVNDDWTQGSADLRGNFGNAGEEDHVAQIEFDLGTASKKISLKFDCSLMQGKTVDVTIEHSFTQDGKMDALFDAKVGTETYNAKLAWSIASNSVKIEAIDNAISKLLVSSPTEIILSSSLYSKKSAEGAVELTLDGKKHSVSGKYELDSENFSAEGQLSSPKLDIGKKSFKLHAKYPTKESVDLQATVTGEASHSAGFSFESNPGTFTVKSSGFIDIPTSKRAQFDVAVDTKSLHAQVTTPSAHHQVKATWDVTRQRGDFTLDIDSPLTKAGNMKYSAMYRTTEQAIEASIECICEGKTYLIAFEHELSSAHISTSVSAQLPQYGVSGQVAKITGTKTASGFDGEIDLKMFGRHKAHGSFMGFPGSAEFAFFSTALPSESIRASYQIVLGNAPSTTESSGSASLVFGEDEYSVAYEASAGSTGKDMRGSMNVKTPWESLPNADLSAKLQMTDGFLMDVDFKSGSRIVPAAGLSAKLRRDAEFMDASFRVTTPIRDYENVALLINLPLNGPSADKKFEPRVTLSTPKSRFALTASLKNTDEKATFDADVSWPGQQNLRVSAHLKKVSPYAFRIDATTPFKGFERISLNTELNLGFPRDGHAFASLKLNDKPAYEGTVALKIQPGMYKIVVDVDTPWEKHNYGLTLRLEKTARKTIHVEFQYPGSTIGAEVDYVFSSWNNVVAKVALMTPFQGFEQIALSLVHQLDNPESLSYNGELGASLGNVNKFLVALKTSVNDDSSDAALKFVLRENHFSASGFHKKFGTHESAQLETSSSWKSLQAIKFGFSATSDDAASSAYSGMMVVNGETWFSATVNQMAGNNREVQVVTPWRSVSGKTSWDVTDKTTALLQFCWDTKAIQESTIAFALNIEGTGSGKTGLIEIITPTRTVTLQGDYALTSMKFEHSVQLSLKRNKFVGYKVVLKNTSDYTQKSYGGLVEVLLPSFPISVSGSAKIVGNDVTINGNLNYNDHVSKFSATYSDHGSWNGESKALHVFFAHPLATSPLSLQSELSQADGVTALNAKIQYNDDRNSDFTFQWTDDASYKTTGLGSEEIHPRVILVSVSHPATDLDIKLQTEFGATNTEKAASIKGSYLDRFKKMHSLALQGSLVPSAQKAALLFELDGETIKMDGLVNSLESGMKAMLNTQRGLHTPLSYSLALDSSLPFGELNMDYGPSRTLSLSAGMPSDREAQFAIRRSMYGNTADDALVLAKLNTSHVFHSKVNWRPAFWNDAVDELKHRMSFLKREFSVTLGDTYAFWQGELEHRFNGLPEAIQQELQEIADAVTNEIRLVEEYLIDLKGEIQKLFDSNSFFLKDMTKVLNFFHGHASNVLGSSARVVRDVAMKAGKLASSTVLIIKDGVVVAVESANDGLKAIDKLIEEAYKHGGKVVLYVTENWDKMSDDAEEWITKKFRAFDAALQAQIEALMGTYKQTLTELLKLSKQLAQWMQDYSETVQEFAKDYQQAAAKNPALAKIVQAYNDYASWLEELHFSEYAVEFKDQISTVIDKMMQEFDAWSHDYKEYVQMGKQLAQGHYDELKQIPMVGYIAETVSRVHNSMEWAWRYYELEQMIRSNMRTIVQMAQKQIGGIVVGLTTGHPAPWDLEHNYVWDPMHGKLEITQHHPFVWTSFRKAPELDRELMDKLSKAFSTMDMNTQWHKFLDTVTSSKDKLLSVTSVLPPFNAYAILAGNGHYVTFDGRAFEFIGACSYTLLHDARDKFSVIVDYASDPASGKEGKRESLRLIQGSNEIRIGSDYKVTLNAKNVDLPWRSSDGVTIRRQSGKISVDNGRGITLECLVAWDACTISLTGWHFGRIGGLLGNYNNEPSDDFASPTGTQMPTVEAFADSWRLDTTACKRTAAMSRLSDGPFPILTKSDKATCDELFKSADSALSPCFSKLNVAAFLPMCHTDVANMNNMPNAKEAACVSAAAYVSACRAVGMDIWMPPQCVKCELENKGVMMAAETIEVKKQDAPAATDVILAVDHGGCVTSEQIAGIVHNVDAELTAAGSKDNKYTLVGYNGETPKDKPHVQTSEGSIWVKAASFKRALETSGIGSAGVEVANVHDAVQFAARLPFRAAVGKAMVLVSCHECGISADDTATYADTLSMLHERDIAFHYITKDPISLKAQKRDPLWPIGYDSRAAYTLKDARKMVGDTQLKAQINIPKDLCVPLALETNGTVFSMEVFQSANNQATKAKKFYSVVAKKVVESAQQPDIQKCDCVADHSGLGTTQCQSRWPIQLDKFVQDYDRLRYDINKQG
ncbi:unnamed protein product [Notodromas monacha]|uniref:Apolipophorin n=1 Tax=Notodromas monacha TaxID=399045 RepID=A0A7R9GAC9_9CRUS|nr:unnamed protein product [Notodromas monacha]CAG0913567.1 unnamed protein product [Notodromas monacha]